MDVDKDYRGKRPQWTDEERAARRLEWYKRYNAKRKDDRVRPGKHYQSMYGISYEDFMGMVDAQGSLCAACASQMKRPNLDHCHKTGKLRAILCTPCNMQVGIVEKHGEKVLAYLEKYGG